MHHSSYPTSRQSVTLAGRTTIVGKSQRVGQLKSVAVSKVVRNAEYPVLTPNCAVSDKSTETKSLPRSLPLASAAAIAPLLVFVLNAELQNLLYYSWNT